MKKIFLVFVAFNAQTIQAQNLFPDNDNVGIGTLDPISKLTVNGSFTINGGLDNISPRPLVSAGTLANGEIRGYSYSGKAYDDGFLRLSAGGGTNPIKTFIDLSAYSSIPDMAGNIVFGTYGYERMRLEGNGNLGIDTNNPQQKFVVSNNNAEGFEVYLDPALSVVGLQSYNRNINAYSKMQLDASQFSFMSGKVGIGTNNPQQNFVVSNNNTEGFEVYLDPALSVVGLQSYNRNINAYSKMELDASQFSFMYGKVGIGKKNPSNELDVNGTIHSKEVKVDMDNWSDFVFKKEYTLPTLEEVEKHIAEKGHLENIPSEEEVLKNGINVGEMNAKLLQKIEELTLYIIEQNREIEVLKSQNQNFKVVFDRLSKIEEKLN